MASYLSQVILDVEDLERSLGFYCGLLKLPVRMRDDYAGHHVVYLVTGDTEILLVQQPIEEQIPHLPRTGGLMLNFQVRNLYDLQREITSRHIEVIRSIEEEAFGDRSMLVSDPDGYAVLISENRATMN